MNADWQNFLTLHDAPVAPTPAPDANDSTVFCNLAQFGVLRVSGTEAQSFLQNLLSNDIREVTDSRAQYSSFNSAKGRMLASLLIWRDGDDYLLQLPASLTDAMRKKLTLYVLRAKVKITDASDELVALGVSGQAAQPFTGAATLPVLSVTRAQGCTAIKVGDTRCLLVTSPALAPALWQTLATQARQVASTHWDWLTIRAGLPVILPQTQEQFVPQMANFDLVGGINFKKGCYPGQEIVARMHYLGKPKRRMYLAHVDSEHPPLPGDELYGELMPESAQEQSQQPAPSCGMIANVAPAPGGGYDLLAIALIASLDSLHMQHGEPLTLTPLPYAIP